MFKKDATKIVEYLIFGEGFFVCWIFCSLCYCYFSLGLIVSQAQTNQKNDLEWQNKKS